MNIIGSGGMMGKGGSNSTPTGEEAPNTLKSKQVARLIDLLSEGPIQGVVDGPKGVFFDSVPVRRPDNTYNFVNANVQFVNGYQSQAVMSGFTSQEAEIGVGPELKKGFPLIRNILNTEIDRCRITVSTPALTNTDKETGNITGSSVTFRIEVNNNGGGYVSKGDFTIDGKTTSNYQRSYTITLPRPGPWDIRVQRITADSTTLNIQNSINWDSYTEITDDKVNYANSACVGTIIDAEQFRSIPKRTYYVEGLLIKYPNNMNPDTGVYTGTWDGTFTFGWCNNPAWVLYDLLVNGRYGLGDYLRRPDGTMMVDKWSFYKAGVFCDQLVPGKSGIYERRYMCDIRITSQREAFDLLQQMSSIFRGFTYWAGDELVLVADQPEDPSDIFTNANVVEGVFNYTGTDLRQRHTQVTVAWQDPKQLGETRLAVVEDQDAISRYGIMPEQEIGYGTVRESQAIRAGKWSLYSQIYEDEQIQFTAGLQGAYLRPGSIVKVMDANIAGRRRGGRIGAGSTSSVIVFDGPVDVVAGRSYVVNCVIVAADNTAQVQTRIAVAPVSGAVTTLAVTNGFSAAPEPDQPWVITEPTLEATLWRAMTISQSERDQYQVTGVRHYPQKWEYVEKNHAFAEPDITDITNRPPPVTNAKVIEYIQQTSAITLAVMATFSWTSKSPLFDVFYHKVNENWRHLRTDQNALTIQVTEGDWQFQVTPISTLGFKGAMTQVNKTIIGLSAPPKTPQKFMISIVDGVALFQWVKATEIDMIIGGFYELRFTPRVSGQQWNTSQVVYPSIPGNASSVGATYQVGTWMLRAFDIGYRPSTSWATIVSFAPDLRYTQYHRICEHPTWLGTHDGTAKQMPQEWLVIAGSGGLWDEQLSNMSTWSDVDALPIPVGGTTPEGYGVYTFKNILDAGAPFSIRLAADILAFPFFGNAPTIDTREGKVDDWPSWDDQDTGLGGDVLIETSTTLDNPLLAGAEWTAWERFVTGEQYAWGWRFRAILTAPPGQNIGVETLCITGDFRAKIDSAEDVKYTAINTRINFRVKFYDLPAVVITIQDVAVTDTIQILNKTTEYFDLKITATGGTNPIGLRTFDWHAQGYGIILPLAVGVIQWLDNGLSTLFGMMT